MTITAAFDLKDGTRLREIPICTARDFREVIEPLARKLSLPLITGWDTMIEVDERNHEDFRNQLLVLLVDLAKSGHAPGLVEHLNSRLKRLLDSASEALEKRSGVVVVIG